MLNLIYLDNCSTTRPDDRVIQAMNSCSTNYFANPSSGHKLGREVNTLIKKARRQISSLLNCEPNNIIYTSGATEAINLGIKGVADSFKKKGNHIITCETEHPAVLNSCRYLESIGYDVTYLPVNQKGLIDLEIFESAIRSETILACLMLVNNETGVIQPIKELVEIAHSKSVFFFCDATQAVGKMPVDIKNLEVDLLCFSGHKFHGPKGVGGLYLPSKQLDLTPQLHGGDQERGMRSGTLNAPGIVGMGVAAEIAQNEMADNRKRIESLRNHLETELLKISGASLNGDSKHRIFNISNISFREVDANDLIEHLDNIMVSNGSACKASLIEPSHVLKGMGLSDDEAYGAIRFSLGNFNTSLEIQETIAKFRALLT